MCPDNSLLWGMDSRQWQVVFLCIVVDDVFEKLTQCLCFVHVDIPTNCGIIN